MLKVERKNARSPAVIKLREKTHFFSPLLVKALLIAFFIHFTAYLVFVIKKEDSISSFLFPSVEVEGMGLAPKNAPTTTITLKSAGKEFNQIPSFADYSNADHLVKIPAYPEDLKNKSSFMDPFGSLEADLLPINFSFSKTSETSLSVDISISGPLAHRSYTYENALSDQEMSLLKNIDNSIQISYDIRIDPLTGKIIWYVLKNKQPEISIKKLSEKILYNIIFNKNSEFSYTFGQLDIFIKKN